MGAVFLQISWTSFSSAMPLLLYAVAFALVLKVCGIWNFAQAGFMSVAFYAIYAGFNMLSFPMWLAILFGFALTLLASLALEPFGLDVLRKRKAPHLTYFILTLVVTFFLAALLSMIFGIEPVTLTPAIMFPSRLVGGVVMSDWDFRALTVGAILMFLLAWFFARTRDGQFMLAVAGNADLAELYGISARRARIVAYLVAAALITGGVWLDGTRGALNAHMSLQTLIFAVAATLLGGVGRVFRAGVAAIVLSLIQGLSILVIASQWQGFVLYAFLFVIIIFFPRGFSVRSLRSALVGKKKMRRALDVTTD